MRKLVNTILPYSIYFFVFGSFAFIYTQIIPFLTYLGFTIFERGLILSSVSLLTLFIQVIYGFFSDKYNTIKPIFNLSYLILGILSFILYQSTSSNFYFVLLLVSLVGSLFRTLAGFLETWTLLSDEKIKLKFGAIRAFGSIGWALTAPLTSIVVNIYGYSMLSYLIIAMVVSSLFLTIMQKDVEDIETAELKFKDIKELIKTPDYVILILIFTVINIGFNTDNFTVIDKMIDLGATNNEIALKWSIQAIIEMPVLFLSTWILLRFNMLSVLRISVIFFIARIGFNGLATTPVQILYVSLFQGITFPLSFIAQKFMIEKITPLKLRSSAQMLGLAIFGAFPAFFTPLVSGILVEYVGYNTTLYLFSITLIVSLLLTFKLTQFHKTKI
ncbi:MAG: MFS transporter [Erysipelothrix sp.]|nr:MFS transporter [Erysipelothrix sp.]